MKSTLKLMLATLCFVAPLAQAMDTSAGFWGKMMARAKAYAGQGRDYAKYSLEKIQSGCAKLDDKLTDPATWSAVKATCASNWAKCWNFLKTHTVACGVAAGVAVTAAAGLAYKAYKAHLAKAQQEVTENKAAEPIDQKTAEAKPAEKAVAAAIK